jgi:hypothetical protein
MRDARREARVTGIVRYLVAMALAAAALTALKAGPAIAAEASDPESGSVSDGAYANGYFRLSVTLPPGWSEGLAGPPPSRLGYYVLAALDGTKADGASLLITAQDLFFSAKPFADAAAMTMDFHDVIAGRPGMAIDAGPEGATIGGQAFQRLDYHAGGLYRVWLAADLRCHVVVFNITGRDQAAVERIVHGLDAIPLRMPRAATGTGATGSVPVCRKDYVTAATLRRKIDPVPIDTTGVKVPVRIIIGADGHVRRVHVISASPAQRAAIVEALMQWEFAPDAAEGHPAEVETGLVFTFKHQGP